MYTALLLCCQSIAVASSVSEQQHQVTQAGDVMALTDEQQ
jgi:hypothetical protein